jgi:hypothetical protein
MNSSHHVISMTTNQTIMRYSRIENFGYIDQAHHIMAEASFGYHVAVTSYGDGNYVVLVHVWRPNQLFMLVVTIPCKVKGAVTSALISFWTNPSEWWAD